MFLKQQLSLKLWIIIFHENELETCSSGESSSISSLTTETCNVFLHPHHCHHIHLLAVAQQMQQTDKQTSKQTKTHHHHHHRHHVLPCCCGIAAKAAKPRSNFWCQLLQRLQVNNLIS